MRLVSAFVLRPLGVLARVAMVIAPLVLLAVGLLYLRLLYDPDKPISVRFLADPIERGLNAEMPGFTFDIGDAVIQRSAGVGLEFRLRDVRVSDGNGNAVAVAKLASVSVAPRALWSLRIAPSRVDLIEPRFLISADDKGRLAVKLPEAAGRAKPSALPTAGAPTAMPPSKSVPDGAAASGEGRKLELGRLIGDVMARVRRDGQTASYLEDFGLRNAIVIVEQGGQRTEWRIPELDIDLQHKQKRSIVEVRARLAGEGEQLWSLKLRAEESEKARAIAIGAEIDGLVPRLIAQRVPQLAALDAIDAPVSGKVSLDLTLDGEVSSGQASLRIGAGAVQVPAIGRGQIALERGTIELKYSAESNSIELLPSDVHLGAGKVTLRGKAVPTSARGWDIAIQSIAGELKSAKAGQPAVPIERLEARAHFRPESGDGSFDWILLKAGGVDFELKAAVQAPGERSSLEGWISPAPLATVLALWPEELAPRTRTWVTENVRKGQVRSGNFRLIPAPGQSTRRLSLSLEAADVELSLAKGLPPIEMPRALLRVEDTSLELTIPDAAMTVSPGRRLTAKGGRFTAVDIGNAQPKGELAARVQGPLGAALDLAEREPLRLIRGLPVVSSAIDGKIDVSVKVAMPLGDTLALADMQIETKARITDGRLKGAFGTHDVSGATVTIEGTEKALDIKGDMLLAGITTRLIGRWTAGASPTDGKSPVAKLVLRLDDADRNQLGLDLERIVRGPVPVEIFVLNTGAEPAVKIQVHADLTSAELELDEIAWRKPSGRPARLSFDLGKPSSGKGVELQNFKVDGENIAIDGWVSIGPDNKAREFVFPEFLVNVVSSFDVQGIMKTERSERVWDVKVRGKSLFDAGDLLRQMLSPTTTTPKPSAKPRPGVDLSVEIDNVLGLNDTRLRQVRLKLQKRNDQVAVVDFRGMLDGGKPLSAVLAPEPGRPRVLRLETADAGQVLKLIGIYQNMIGGTGTLALNLDGRGAAERQGQVTVTNFRVLGDSIASEVFQAPDDSRPLIAQQPRPDTRRVLREQFDFEELFAQFSVGNGQLAIDNALARGPLVGVSLRGKVDFRSRRVEVGGTYVPLSGLSRAFSEIPLLGLVLTGPNGEGVLGITFLVKGAMANPQVTVNPFSPLTLGLLREFMQMAPENISITPQAEPKKAPPSAKGGPQLRSSPPAAAQPGASVPRTPEVLDGWTATSKQPTKK